MCDHSLQHVAFRPAQTVDELIVVKFPLSITRGFCAVDEPRVAVCLLPGTELAFERDVECDRPFAWLFPKYGFGKLGQKVARFRHVDMHSPGAHHHALEFPNGKIVLVTRLRLGQRAKVLQLPAVAEQPKASSATYEAIRAAAAPSIQEIRP